MNTAFDSNLIWIIAGFALLIIELMTGTFYLLVLGLGAFAAAAAGWMGAGFLVQAIVGGVVACIGTYIVYRWHETHHKKGAATANELDTGQAVIFESWVDEHARLARIKYRGASWDARIEGHHKHEAGATLYIRGQEGSAFVVADR